MNKYLSHIITITVIFIVFAISIVNAKTVHNDFNYGGTDSVSHISILPTASQTNLKPAQQQALDNALLKLQQQLQDNSSKIVDNMSDLALNVPPPTLADRLDAEKLFRFLDANADRVLKFIDFTDLVRLPIGLSKNIGDNTTVTLGVLQAEYKKDYAELKVFVRIQYRVNDGSSALDTRDLFFGIDKLKFTNQGGFDGGGTFRAVLLGDFTIPLKNWTVVLKGGLGVTSSDYSKTYVEFDCNEFKSASLDAQIVFPRCTLLPYDVIERKPKTQGRVAFDFRAAINNQSGMKGILATLSAQTLDNEPFCVPGAEKFGFKLTGATYDQNDFLNASDMFFPEDYQGDKSDTWNGIFIRGFEVYLPKAFTKESNENEAGKITCLKSFGGKTILIDRTGFTGTIFYKNDCKQDSNYVAQKWKFTLSTIELSFLQSQFEKGTFGGGVSIPIHEGENNQAALINYEGTIAKGDQYSLIIALGSDLPINIKALRAKGKLFQGSWVKFEYLNNKFYPSANLSAEFSVGTKVTGSQSDIENTLIDPDNQTASFKGLRFSNLFFQTKQAPYVKVDSFEFSADTKIAGFPVDVKLSKRTDPLFGASPDPNNDLWIDFGLMVGVAENKFSGSSTMVIKTSYEDGRLKFKGLSLTSLYISGSTTAFDLAGGIEIYENDEVKGFRGAIKAKLKTPFVAEFEANANFGYQKVQDYRYGYIDVYAALDAPGVAIPTGIGDLAINGAGLGIYFNMRPQFKGATTGSGCNFSNNSQIMTYCPDNQIPFGFKIALGLKTLSESFRGRLNLDFALDRQYGINSISLYGSGVFGGKFDASVGGDEKNQFQKSLGSSVDGKTNDEISNVGAGNLGQNELVAKADSLNKKKKPTPQNPGGWDFTKEGDIAVAIGIMVNVPQATLHAEAAVYVNKGQLVGVGTDGLVGRAVLHWGKDDLLGTNNTVFYIHAGNPSIRMGIKYASIVSINAYLMIGWGVPNFPPPPAIVLTKLGLSPNYFTKPGTDYTKIKTGTAFALGAGIKLDVRQHVKWSWNIRANVDAGFDLLLSNNDYCNPEVWLGRGQIYGLLDAGLYRGDSRKFGTSLALLLRGNGLKPLGASGYASFYPPFIGWITGDIRIGVKFGDICN